MKTIENKVVTLNIPINVDGRVVEMITDSTYGDLILQVAKRTTQEGYSYDDIRTIRKIEKAIEKVDGFINKKGVSKEDSLKRKETPFEDIEVEDAEYDYIKSKLSQMKWIVIDDIILDFTDYINSLK